MEALTIAVLPAHAREALEGRLPQGVEARWWETGEELVALAAEAEIGWFDMFDKAAPLEALRRAERLRWLFTGFAGVDWMPLDMLAARGVTLTNGAGLNATAVAEFAVLSMLAVARDWREIVRAQERCEWLAPQQAPEAREMAGSRALVLGRGSIGREIATMLAAMRVEVDLFGRGGRQQWRAMLGDYDWIVLALPLTPETRHLLDAETIAAMGRQAVLVNVARAEVVDQDALAGALAERRISGAVLDLTDPEPLPPGHPLWQLDNCHVTMHLAGMPTPASRARAQDRFVANCASWLTGGDMEALVDLSLGY